jgi:hypothetical protein
MKRRPRRWLTWLAVPLFLFFAIGCAVQAETTQLPPMTLQEFAGDSVTDPGMDEEEARLTRQLALGAVGLLAATGGVVLYTAVQVRRLYRAFRNRPLD